LRDYAGGMSLFRVTTVHQEEMWEQSVRVSLLWRPSIIFLNISERFGYNPPCSGNTPSIILTHKEEDLW
jgi:hypothetical protein